MSHLLVPLTPATTKPISRITKKKIHLPSQKSYKVRPSGPSSDQVAQGSHFQRRFEPGFSKHRTKNELGSIYQLLYIVFKCHWVEDWKNWCIALGFGVLLGLSIGGENAKAAKRAPPPPVQEKKDPSVSSLMAKVIASKKRKEAMNDSMAKLREKGKAIQEQSQ